MEQGSAVTNEIQYTPNNELTGGSQPVIDQVGQMLQQNPDMNIQVNSMEELPVNDPIVDPNTGMVMEEKSEVAVLKSALKKKADKIRAYLINKFKIRADRIIADVKVKATEKAANNKLTGQTKKLLTEFIKL
jgi:hypothetical protein